MKFNGEFESLEEELRWFAQDAKEQVRFEKFVGEEQHLSDEELVAFIEKYWYPNTLSVEQAGKIVFHLAGCAACHEREIVFLQQRLWNAEIHIRPNSAYFVTHSEDEQKEFPPATPIVRQQGLSVVSLMAFGKGKSATITVQLSDSSQKARLSKVSVSVEMKKAGEMTAVKIFDGCSDNNGQVVFNVFGDNVSCQIRLWTKIPLLILLWTKVHDKNIE